MKKKIRLVIIFFTLLFFCEIQDVYAQDSFQGNRKCICSISLSDLENFVIGGRSSLEMVMAKNEEDWYSCTTEAKGRNLFVFLSYSFDSYKDYASKTESLLGYAPITTYGDNKIPYAENFMPNELFHFLELNLKKSDVLVEVELEDILHTEKDTIEIKGQSYSGTTSVNTGTTEKLLFSEIEINTVLSEGSYNRKLHLRFGENVDFETEMNSRCEKTGATLEIPDETRCYVSYTADSEAELIKKTMLILQTAVSIEHEKLYESQDYFRIKTTESIDVSSIMEKDNFLEYELSLVEMEEIVSALPEKTEETYTESEDVFVRSNIVSYNGKDGKITYYYSCKFGFDQISIITDLSKQFGRTKRTIEFWVDSGIAKEYHEGIKSRLESLLKRGDSLRIYEKTGYYCYAISYESWLTDDINRFTNRILEINSSNLQFKKSAFPFVKSDIQDTLNLQNISVGTDMNTINIKYILPNNTKVDDVVEVYDEEKCILMDSGLSYTGNMQYSCFHYVKLLMYIVVIGFFISTAYMVMRKLKDKLLVVKEQNEKKKRIRKTGEFCPICGEKRNAERAFCGKCGYKF